MHGGCCGVCYMELCHLRLTLQVHGHCRHFLYAVVGGPLITQVDNPQRDAIFPVGFLAPAPVASLGLSMLPEAALPASSAAKAPALCGRVALWQRRPAGVQCFERVEVRLSHFRAVLINYRLGPLQHIVHHRHRRACSLSAVRGRRLLRQAEGRMSVDQRTLQCWAGAQRAPPRDCFCFNTRDLKRDSRRCLNWRMPHRCTWGQHSWRWISSTWIRSWLRCNAL